MATSTAVSIVGFKKQLQTDHQNQIKNYFSGDADKAMKFLTSVAIAVEKTPKLLECDRASLMNAFMTCAELNLYPSNVTGEAFVIPYGGKAQFQLGYQGVLTLLYRAGVQSVRSAIVYEKDHFDYQEGTGAKLIHKPDIRAKDRGKAIAVYAVAVVNDHELFKVMSEADVMKHKALSQAAKSKFSPWTGDNDPELIMWQKTAIKVLAKTLPKNDSVYHKAVAAEEKGNKDETIQPAGNALNTDEAAEDEELEEGYEKAKKGDLSDAEKKKIVEDEAKEAEQGSLV